jgi:DNA-binding MarR family transcriptional regulator
MSKESREFLDALEGLMESVQKDQRSLLRDWKVTPLQYFVLRYVLREKGAPMSQIATFLGVRPQTMTPIGDALEHGGWVRRIRSAEDRRESRLELTPRGRRLIESIHAGFFEDLGRVLDEAPRRPLTVATGVLTEATVALRRDRDSPRRTVARPS